MNTLFSIIGLFAVIVLLIVWAAYKDSKKPKVEACEDPEAYLGDAGRLD